jgi:hypothetical protein
MRAPTNTFQNGRKNNPAAVVKLAAKRKEMAERVAATKDVDPDVAQADAAAEDLRPGLVAAADSAAPSADAAINGVASGETIEKAVTKWSENVEAASHTRIAVSHGLQEISREWLGWIKAGTENSQQGFLALMKCRSPREFFEVQGRILNRNLELFTASTRRIAAISAEITNNASRKIAPAS